MREIIKRKPNSKDYVCELCPGNPSIGRRSVYRHITNSTTHSLFVKSRRADYDELVRLIEEVKAKNKAKKTVD